MERSHDVPAKFASTAPPASAADDFSTKARESPVDREINGERVQDSYVSVRITPNDISRGSSPPLPMMIEIGESDNRQGLTTYNGRD
jgi:hypothetical protein